jgi:DNA uptake protein ComE-like DNA-binding protein
MRKLVGLPAALLAATLVVSACGFFHRGESAPDVLDLNGASRRRLEQLPGITPTLAAQIVEGRPYEEPEDLVRRNILTERELRRIEDRVTVKRSER